MKKILFVMGCFFVTSAQAMEDLAVVNARYAAPFAKNFSSSVPWDSLPFDLMVDIKNNYGDNNAIVYLVDSPLGGCVLPYTLRIINRDTLRMINRDFIKTIDDARKKALLRPQYGLEFDSYCVLSNYNSMRNYFQWTPVIQKINNVWFDGINDNQLSLVAHANEYRYKVYVLKQTDENTARNPKKLSPAIAGKDCLQSILLHRECDRCVLGIKFVKPTTGKIHRIDIKDVSPCNSKLVASLVTNFVLKKAIYVGKNTYLGLVEDGGLVVFWLNNKKMIQYAHQDCHGKQFKDLDVDETVKTASGFMPRVALLANNGEVFLTDLRMGQEKKFLLYSCTLENPENISRFFYHKKRCAVVYKKSDVSCRSNIYDTFHVWSDNFNLLLAYASLKASQQRMCRERK